MQKVIYGEDYIQIKENGKELVYWTESEWVEDSQLIFSICNAVQKATKNKLKIK